MSQNYQEIYQSAISRFEEVMRKAGTFEKEKVIEPDGSELDSCLGNLEKSLRENKYASRLAASIRDIMLIHYWADISEKGWNSLYEGLKELANPETMTRESMKKRRLMLLEERLTWLPVTKRAEKDIAEVKKGLGLRV